MVEVTGKQQGSDKLFFCLYKWMRIHSHVSNGMFLITA